MIPRGFRGCSRIQTNARSISSLAKAPVGGISPPDSASVRPQSFSFSFSYSFSRSDRRKRTSKRKSKRKISNRRGIKPLPPPQPSAASVAFCKTRLGPIHPVLSAPSAGKFRDRFSADFADVRGFKPKPPQSGLSRRRRWEGFHIPTPPRFRPILSRSLTLSPVGSDRENDQENEKEKDFEPSGYKTPPTTTTLGGLCRLL